MFFCKRFYRYHKYTSQLTKGVKMKIYTCDCSNYHIVPTQETEIIYGLVCPRCKTKFYEVDILSTPKILSLFLDFLLSQQKKVIYSYLTLIDSLSNLETQIKNSSFNLFAKEDIISNINKIVNDSSTKL